MSQFLFKLFGRKTDACTPLSDLVVTLKHRQHASWIPAYCLNTSSFAQEILHGHGRIIFVLLSASLYRSDQTAQLPAIATVRWRFDFHAVQHLQMF